MISILQWLIGIMLNS